VLAESGGNRKTLCKKKVQRTEKEGLTINNEVGGGEGSRAYQIGQRKTKEAGFSIRSQFRPDEFECKGGRSITIGRWKGRRGKANGLSKEIYRGEEWRTSQGGSNLWMTVGRKIGVEDREKEGNELGKQSKQKRKRNGSRGDREGPTGNWRIQGGSKKIEASEDVYRRNCVKGTSSESAGYLYKIEKTTREPDHRAKALGETRHEKSEGLVP